MEYSYLPPKQIGFGETQLFMQPRKEVPVNDPPPSCMYNGLRASTSGYSVITPQTIASVNNSPHFAPPISCFPGNPPCEVIASDNQQQLNMYIQSLQKLLYNFAMYRFHCKLTTEIYGSYLGQTHVQMVLRKAKLFKLGLGMKSVISVDLSEIITIDAELSHTTEELLELVHDQLFLTDASLEHSLPQLRCKYYPICVDRRWTCFPVERHHKNISSTVAPPIHYLQPM